MRDGPVAALQVRREIDASRLAVICQHADCTSAATVKTRFGDGMHYTSGSKGKQTFVHYCDPHYQAVDKLFRLCDVTLLAEVA